MTAPNNLPFASPHVHNDLSRNSSGPRHDSFEAQPSTVHWAGSTPDFDLEHVHIVSRANSQLLSYNTIYTQLSNHASQLQARCAQLEDRCTQLGALNQGLERTKTSLSEQLAAVTSSSSSGSPLLPEPSHPDFLTGNHYPWPKQGIFSDKLNYWTEDQWKASAPKARPGGHSNRLNVAQRFLEGGDGKIVSGDVATLARGLPRTLFGDLAAAGIKAESYKGLPYVARGWLYYRFGLTIPESRNCDNGRWKTDLCLSEPYRDFVVAQGFFPVKKRKASNDAGEPAPKKARRGTSLLDDDSLISKNEDGDFASFAGDVPGTPIPSTSEQPTIVPVASISGASTRVSVPPSHATSLPDNLPPAPSDLLPSPSSGSASPTAQAAQQLTSAVSASGPSLALPRGADKPLATSNDTAKLSSTVSTDEPMSIDPNIQHSAAGSSEQATTHVTPDLEPRHTTSPGPRRSSRRTNLRFAPPPAAVTNTPTTAVQPTLDPAQSAPSAVTGGTSSQAAPQVHPNSISSTRELPKPRRSGILLRDKLTQAKSLRATYFRELEEEEPGILYADALRRWTKLCQPEKDM